jgi:hypothetical protein
MKLCHKFLNSPLAHAPRRHQEVVVVGGSEMGCQKADCRKCQRAIRKHLEEDRKSPRGSCRLDPAVRGMFREPEGLSAVAEEGGVPFAEVQAPLIEYGQMGNEGHGCLALLMSEGLQPGEKVPIG